MNIPWLSDLIGETWTGSSTFLLIGLISITLLVISFILEGIFDFLEFGDGPLSLTTISAFGALFGFTGYAVMGVGASVTIATLAGAALGLVGGALAWWVTRMFQNSDSTASVEINSLLGSVAQVILRIPGDGTLGEIALNRNGHRHTFSAISDEAVAVGKAVKIISVISNSSVVVKEIKDN